MLRAAGSAGSEESGSFVRYPGHPVVYEYTITNYNENYPAQDITLVDDRFGDIQLPNSNLGPRESMIVTMEHEVNENDLKNLYEGVFIANNATVDGTIDGKKIPSPFTALAIVATPIQIIQKTALTSAVKVGDEIKYEITVYNPTDTVHLTNVKIKDTFDMPVDFVSANPMPTESNDIWVFDSIGPKESKHITLTVKPQEQETPYVLKNCATITNIDDKTIEEYFDDIKPSCPDIAQLLPYFSECESVTVLSKEYSTIDSFEELLRDQHKLLTSFDKLMGQTLVTREQKIEFLYSIEDLYRRQAMGIDKFSSWIEENWAKLTPAEEALVTDSLEDLLRRQAKNLEAFNGNLLAWVKNFDQVYRQKFSDSFEDLLHRQVALLKKFNTILLQDGMQTPLFLSSFEDLLRRQAQSLVGFGDLGEFTFDPAPPLEGPGIAIYKTGSKTSLSCDEEVTYNYTVYNNGDQEVTGIEITDLNLPGGPYVGTIPSLGVYQSELVEKTVTYGCLPNIVYPTNVCNSATAKGKASSGETVEAKSNEVCIILNGPRPPVPEFVLEKTAQPKTASLGEEIAYTYVIRNNGKLPITSIKIEDDKLGEITISHELQPGESKQYTKSTEMGDSDIINTATATGIEGIGDIQSQVPQAQFVTSTATTTVTKIECGDVLCAPEIQARLNGRIERDLSSPECYYFMVYPTTPSPPVRRFELMKGKNTLDSVWNQITNNVGKEATIMGCLYQGWSCGTNPDPQGPGIVVNCVGIWKEPNEVVPPSE
jgi:uncharacterized repeat protein (TIGR01451 family)